MLDLEAIKARLAAITPGPWEVADSLWVVIRRVDSDTVERRYGVFGAAKVEADAAFIAAAPADVAALLAEVERLRAALEEYGEHAAPCAIWIDQSRVCTCGLAEELRA